MCTRNPSDTVVSQSHWKGGIDGSDRVSSVNYVRTVDGHESLFHLCTGVRLGKKNSMSFRNRNSVSLITNLLYGSVYVSGWLSVSPYLSNDHHGYGKVPWVDWVCLSFTGLQSLVFSSHRLLFLPLGKLTINPIRDGIFPWEIYRSTYLQIDIRLYNLLYL